VLVPAAGKQYGHNGSERLPDRRAIDPCRIALAKGSNKHRREPRAAGLPLQIWNVCELSTKCGTERRCTVGLEQVLVARWEQYANRPRFYTLSVILGTVAFSYGSVPMYKMVSSATLHSRPFRSRLTRDHFKKHRSVRLPAGAANRFEHQATEAAEQGTTLRAVYNRWRVRRG
jgi:hypothetical protein